MTSAACLIPSLTFLNHASFLLETEKANLLVDPWLEGTAFNNGWSLLDNSTSNESVYAKLNNGKKTIIWYSHEHSDHLSISFLKNYPAELKGTTKVLFHHTMDKRVVNFLRKFGFNVDEQYDGHPFRFDNGASIFTFVHQKSSDSFCLINIHGTYILNVNDCIIETEKQARAVRELIAPITRNIGVLFTQFGYANWIGNEDDAAARAEAARKKLSSMALQIEHFDPEVVIPFASFVFFSHLDNFYMNDKQNGVEVVFDSDILRSWRDRFLVLKPFDRIAISELEIDKSAMNANSIRHWTNKRRNIKLAESTSNIVDLDKINRAWMKYRHRVLRSFLIAPHVLEMMGFIPRLRIHLVDLNTSATLSYSRPGISFESRPSCDCHIRCTSEVLNFVLLNDFGFNATHVNGRFRSVTDEGERCFARFFSLQEHLKEGRGIHHPIATSKYVLSLLRTSRREPSSRQGIA